MSHKGNKIEIDGYVFDSELEASFYQRFLMNSGIEFEYDNVYSDASKHRYDFFVPSGKLYIEVVPFDTQYICWKYAATDLTRYVIKGTTWVPIHVNYRDRATPKRHGAIWRPDVSNSWMLPVTEVGNWINNHTLRKFIPEEYFNRSGVWVNANFNDYATALFYKSTLAEEMGCNFIAVSKRELDETNLWQMLVKNEKGCIINKLDLDSLFAIKKQVLENIGLQQHPGRSDEAKQIYKLTDQIRIKDREIKRLTTENESLKLSVAEATNRIIELSRKRKYPNTKKTKKV